MEAPTQQTNYTLDISESFAELLRRCMNFIASEDTSPDVTAAARGFLDLLLAIKEVRENVLVRDVVLDGLMAVRADHSEDNLTGEAIAAAKSGLRFLVERSRKDGCARARSSKPLMRFLSRARAL